MAEAQIGIGSGEDAFALVQKHMDERRWWIIPVASKGAMALAQYIEKTYYDGDKNQYFNMVMTTAGEGSALPFTIVFFAHKEYLTMEELRRLLKLPEDDGTADLRDILWTSDTPEAFFIWFMRTFKGDPGRDDSSRDQEGGGANG